MSEKVKYTVEQFNKDIPELQQKLNLRYDCIYPVPRGGIPVAAALAGRLGIPIVTDLEKVKRKDFCLVVDDLVDTGKTREKFINYDFACLHVKEWTPDTLMPTYYLSVEKDWIVYWWEEQAKTDGLEDNITRILQFIGEDPTRYNLSILQGIIIDRTREVLNDIKN